jgi:hypothetical protein
VIATGLIPVTELVAPAVAVIAAFTVKLTVAVVLAMVPRASVTLNTTLADVYNALGVPDTRPVLELIVTPAGNVPELTE